jgi:hypothetical protein
MPGTVEVVQHEPSAKQRSRKHSRVGLAEDSAADDRDPDWSWWPEHPTDSTV